MMGRPSTEKPSPTTGWVRSSGPISLGTAIVVVVVLVVVLVVLDVVEAGGAVPATVDVGAEATVVGATGGSVDAADEPSSAADPHAATTSAAARRAEVATGRIGANVPHRGRVSSTAGEPCPTIRVVSVISRRFGRHAVAAALSVLLVAGAVACGADAEESAAQRGAGLYRANCAACHGDDLDGTSRGPSLLEEVYLEGQLSDAAMADAIRNGVEERLWDFGPMPAAGGLGDAQIREIVAYVRSRQAAAEAP